MNCRVISVLVMCGTALSAQTANPPAPLRAPQKQIDIGAAEAPLSDSERVDLDKAVRKHDYTGEKAVIDRATAEHPNSYELLVVAGRLAYLEKQPKNAAEAFQNADAIRTLSEQDRLTLALAYEFAGRPVESHGELVKLTKLAPKNAEYWYLLGRVDIKNRHLDDAVEDLSKTIRLDPNFLRAYEDLGQTQQDLGYEDQARKTFEEGAEVNRRQPTHWEWSPLDLGIMDLKANQLSEAEKLIREALQYNPRFAWGHYYMGQWCQKQNRDGEAIEEYKEAVVDDPRLRQSWLALAREFNRQGNKVEAERSLAVYKKLEDQENALRGRKN